MHSNELLVLNIYTASLHLFTLFYGELCRKEVAYFLQSIVILKIVNKFISLDPLLNSLYCYMLHCMIRRVAV